jgi:hypothetical protein
MTTDTYSIQVAVDSTSAVTATRNLTAMEQATGRSERALSSLGSVAKIAGSALAGISIASLARDILKVNMEFESLRTSLETVTGSAKNAKIAFEGINTFAAKTPYSVKEVTEAFIKMKSLGLSPSEKALTSFGNTASAMGQSLNRMVEAVANATTGEFDNLKAFGIKASKQGDDIKFTFKGVETKIKDSSEAIVGYLTKIGNTDFSGGMERQGQTMKGTLSSLADAWDNFIDHILSDKSGGAISRWITNATSALGKFDVWLNGATTSIGKLAELQQEQNRLQASINAHNQNGVIGSLIDDLSGFDASGKQSKLAKNIEEQKRLRKELEDEKKVMVDITKAAPVSKIDEPDKKAAAKAAAEAKRAQSQATKELALAEKDYNEQINMQVAAAENAGKLFAAQQQTKIAALEAERVSISDKAAIEYESAKTYEEKSRILNQSQSATNLLLAKEKEIRDSLTNQSTETIDAKIAAAQAELDNAGKYNLTLAEQLRLKTEIAGLQTDKAVLAETSTQSDIKAKSDAEQKYNDDKLASIKAISDAQTAANTAASAQMDILTANLESAKEAATGLADAFGSVGGAVGGLGVALASYEKSQAAITDGLQNQLFEIQKLNDGKGDQAKADKAIATASQKQSQLQVKSYGDMAAAAQGFFKKGTAGYNALGVATKVFRAFEMAQSAMSMVRMIADNGAKVGAYITGLFTSTAANAASVAPNVAADAAKATASGTAAVASASAAPFPIGFATGAAMLAFMLAIGVAMAGGGGSSAPQMSGADYQKAQSEKYNETIGGTVLGSSDASKSIINALDIISANSTADLDYSKGMAESLQKLTYSIDNVTASVAQKMDFGRNGVSLAGSSKTTGVFGSAGGGIGGLAIGYAISNLGMPILGLILGAFTTVTKITKQFAGSGFKFMDELYSSVVKNGTTSVQQYIDILVTETKSSFFGLVSSSKQWITTKYKTIEERVNQAFTDTILGIGNSIIKTADLLGQNTATLTDQVNNFNVELGRIPMERTNYKGKGSRQRNQENAEINEERLSAAFEKLSDKMAMLSPQFLESQKIQEGYYQTLMRVTVAISTANTKLKAMGINAIEYTDIVEKRGDIEKQMIVQSLQLASVFTDVNDIIGKLPGTADDIIEAFKGLNSIKAGLSDIGLGAVKLTQDMINVAGGISAFSASINDFMKSTMSPEQLANANASKMQKSLWDLGFINMPKLTSNAQDAIDVYKYIVQEAAKDTTEAGNYILTKLIGMAGDFAAVAEESAKYVTDATVEINAKIKEQQDLISKTEDQRIAIYKKMGELDPVAKEEALRLEREKSMKGMDGLTATYTQSLNMLTDAMTQLNAATTELNTSYKALVAMRDKYSNIATTLSNYLDELNNTASDYENAKALFLKTSELAKSGNEQALQDMTSVSKAFLSASKAQSDTTVKSLQTVYNSLVTLRDKFKSISQTLKDYKNDLMGAGNPQGSPESVYQSTKKAFEDANLLAASGNEQALTNLPNTAKAFLDASLKYNATGAMYQTDYQSVLNALDKATGVSDSQIDILNKQLSAAESADKSLISIDETALSVDEAIKQYQSALAAQSAIDTTRYEEDKKLVAQNVSDALAKTNEQITLMTQQLTAAETANAKLEDLKTKTDTVDGGISRLSTAVNDYISADLTFSNALAMNKTLLTDLSGVIKQSEINIINQQTAATAAAASAAAAQAQAMAIAAQDTNSLRAANMNMNYSVDSINPIKPLDLNASYNQAPSTISNIVSAITLSNAMSDITVKPYANGGIASGLSLVGEQGAELINFTSPANVTSHQQTNGLFDSIGNAIDDQSVLLKEQIIELKALVNLQSSANVALINEMQGMKEELSTISRKAKLEAAA